MKLFADYRRSLLFAALALVSTWPAEAHEGHHHNAMGTIHAVRAAQLDLETKDGKIESFQLNEKTTFKRGDAAAKREDLKVGERAVVMYESKDRKNVAVEVKLGTAGHEGHEGHAALPATQDSATAAEVGRSPVEAVAAEGRR